MRIAQIIYTGFGGLGSVAFSLVDADRRRHDWLIGFIGDQSIDRSYPARCEAAGVAWKEFRSVAGRPYGAWARLARWLDEVRPDAVILHSINSILPCRWYAWQRSVPLIAVEHSSNLVKSRSEKLASRLCMALADRVVLLTPEYERELAEFHGLLYRSRKVRIIANGIDVAAYAPATNRTTVPDEVRLGMAGRFSFSKRQDLLVHMLGVLRAAHPDASWRLSLAGDGQELQRVKAVATELGLADHVEFTGLLDEPGLGEWMRGLDIYVHASDGETLSTALLQAMATACPIVASDVTGIRNLLNGAAPLGELAANDANVFAEKVADLWFDADRRRTLGARARAASVTSYSNDTMLACYLGLIDEIIRER